MKQTITVTTLACLIAVSGHAQSPAAAIPNKAPHHGLIRHAATGVGHGARAVGHGIRATGRGIGKVFHGIKWAAY